MGLYHIIMHVNISNHLLQCSAMSFYPFCKLLIIRIHPDQSSTQFRIWTILMIRMIHSLQNWWKDIAEHQQMWFEISTCIKIWCNYIHETVMISPIQLHAISETVWFEVISHNCLDGLMYTTFCHHLITNIAQDIPYDTNQISFKIQILTIFQTII